ncbi:hypothetical protein ABBQ32_008622 [Trebouxia sp. C0010 RCD-2024]
MIIVGLTGGIATGKSTVTALLRGHRLKVLDCDEIAHSVIRQGRWGYRRVIRTFGTQILLADGAIDREKLGELVFKDNNARKQLNKATHLPVAVELARQLVKEWLNFSSIVVVDMPLLFETHAYRLMWPRITVTCSHEAEVERLMQRDKCTASQAERKVAAQMPLHLKEEMSQFIVDNSGNRSHCEHQVSELAHQLRSKYKLLGMATSPLMMLGLIWVSLKVVTII